MKTAMLSKERGFTLIEILIAIVILVVGLLGLISTTTGVIQGNALSKQITTAVALAQDEMEALKNRVYTHSDLTAGAHNDPGNPLNGIFTRTWAVTINSPAANMKTIVVTVAWTWKGGAHTVSLSTIRAS